MSFSFVFSLSYFTLFPPFEAFDLRPSDPIFALLILGLLLEDGSVVVQLLLLLHSLFTLVSRSLELWFTPWPVNPNQSKALLPRHLPWSLQSTAALVHVATWFLLWPRAIFWAIPSPASSFGALWYDPVSHRGWGATSTLGIYNSYAVQKKPIA